MSRLETALQLALEAEKIILAAYQDPRLHVELKKDKTVVTETDRVVELHLRARISELHPGDGIIGEEHAKQEGTSGFEWILDPIDGTQSFICGVPLFGTLIGVTHQQKPLIGVAHMPVLKETYFAERGKGAFWRTPHQTVNAQVSKTPKLSDSLFITTSPAGFERAKRRPLFDELIKATKKFRGWGSCYGHCLIATGRADVMVEPDLKIWDCAALEPIVKEAGGEFFDLQGQNRIDGGSAISCNAHLADEMKRLLQTSSAPPQPG